METNFYKDIKYKKIIYRVLSFMLVVFLWHLLAKHYNQSLILPAPELVFEKLWDDTRDVEVLRNLMITLGRVLKGFSFAFVIGVTFGFLMGYFKPMEYIFGNFIDAIRQVPMMAWVPLTIIWFGIGDGPTIFLIGLSGVFPILLNTIQGVKSVPKNYYYAAESMGASKGRMFLDITLPWAIPDILTGSRLAVGIGWMSVI